MQRCTVAAALRNLPTARESIAAVMRHQVMAYTDPGKPRGCMIVLAVTTSTDRNHTVHEHLAEWRLATEDDFRFARELGLPISVHVGMAGFPGSVDTLDKLGLLGPDVNFAHAARLTEREFELIAASGGTIALCPSIDMGMAMASYPATGRALALGIPTGLAVDTTTAAGTDLFSEMRIALAAERSRANAEAVSRDEAVETVELDQRDMLRLATMDAARTWHLQDEVGSLTPGKRADVTIVDLRTPHLDGFADPVTTMVLGAGPSDVETVIAGGEVVKADGALVGAHIGRARELMHESRARLRRTWAV